jgi:6-phospho-beta-glucosidase
VTLAPLEPEVAGLVHEAKAYERLAVRAATSGSRDVALKALLSNPLVPSYDVAVGLLEALLETNRPFLGRFFPDDPASSTSSAT